MPHHRDGYQLVQGRPKGVSPVRRNPLQRLIFRRRVRVVGPAANSNRDWGQIALAWVIIGAFYFVAVVAILWALYR